MATRRAAVIVDENFIHQDSQSGVVKKTTLTTTTRRPALGNLANRTDKSRILNDKKAAPGSGENANNSGGTGIDLKNVKARVDTHWKHEPLRKPLLTKSTVSAAVKTNSGPKLVRTKTIETATIKDVKVIDKKKESTLTSCRAGPSQEKSVVTRKVSETTTQPKTDSAKFVEAPVFKSRFEPQNGSSYSNGLIDGFGGLNIDEGDEDNTLLVCEYVNEIYAYLFEMEHKYAIRKEHLDGQAEVQPRMRAVLLDWINEVHSQYHFTQETFHSTVSIIDRYLQTVKTTSRKNLQLVGVAALFIASKYEELYPPEVQDFVYITDYTYTKEKILSMEKHILMKLKFEMGAPTAIHFLRRFSKAAQADSKTHILSKYFIELASIDYKLSEYLPSEIAAASVFISLNLMQPLLNPDEPVDMESLWTGCLQFYTTYSIAHLMPIVKEMVTYILAAPTSKTNNVYQKYCSQKQGEMAIICDRSKNILNAILEKELC